jgi:outer membrane receptor protein involved in Fe transport
MNPSVTGMGARRASLRLLSTAIFVAPALALAAEESELAEVVVTGSRIAAPNMESSSPVLAVTAEDIRVGGRLDLTDMLNLLPQVNSNSLGEDLGNRTSGLTSAGGVSTADLRGLGPSHTLVLVDGRRLGAGSPQTVIQAPAPDIDQIPSALIERVEVVTGGASAVYGSDAIAGVVNFITRRDFEGLQLDAQLGGNWHDNNNGFARRLLQDAQFEGPRGSTWDGRTLNMDLVAGANIMEGRGNVTAFFGYQSIRPVRSTQRDFGACQMFYTSDLGGAECGGSANSNYFRPTSADANPDGGEFSVQGDQFVEWGTDGTAPPAIFNTQPFIYMQRGDKRYNGGFLAHVDVNEHVKPYAEFSFMDDRTHQEVAPTALFSGANVLSDTGNYLVNCSNPLLSAQQASLMCTPGEIAADALAPGSVSADVDIGRRNVEGGPRTYEFTHTNYRMVLGSRGDIARGWTYDAYGQYFYTNFSNYNGRDISFDKIANALQVTTDADGNPVCISGSGCVPYNIFTEGGVTPEALGYLTTPGTATGNTSLKTVHADVTVDLGEYGLRLPAATQSVKLNAGWEYRREHVTYLPDAAELGGLIVGLGGAYPSIDNSVSVKEGFAELRVPIVHDRPGMYDMVAEAGYRHSLYSQTGGVDTYKFGLQYEPLQGYRLRASYNRAIRAPSIVELFNPQLVGKIQFGEDPCAPSEDDGTLAATFEECARTGVTQQQYDNASIPQGTAGQLTQLQGGNPDLKPERADTYSIGMTFRPNALPDFTGSLDYFHINMKDLIGALPAQLILSNCLNTGDPTFCSQISRHPLTGTLNGASVAGGGYIVQTNVNISDTTLDGLDLQTAYRLRMGTLGSLTLMLNGSYMLKNDSTPVPGGGSYDCTGLFGPTCQTVNPKWRHSLRGSWSFVDDISVALTWRFFTGVKLDNNDADPDLRGTGLEGELAGFRTSMPATSYFDLAGTWDVGSRLQLRAGINNLLDKDPPIAPSEITSGGAPNYYEFYDGLGRQVFAAVTAKF